MEKIETAADVQKISIIIIAKNEEKYLPQLLESLAAQSNQQFEIIVVDSDSKDKTRQYACAASQYFPEFKYLKLDSAKGPAYARNQGEAVASYERLLFMDADTLLFPTFIDQILKEIQKKQPDIASCPLRISEKRLGSNIGAVLLNFFMIYTKSFYSSAYGACLLSTKSVHQALQGFREDLAICEDCNYVKRARKEFGYKFYILSPKFYSSDRRAMTEGAIQVFLKYIRIHIVRMFTGKEYLLGQIKYDYGDP